jgi:hypothetical protein
MLKHCISSRLWVKSSNDHLLLRTSILYVLREAASECSIDLCEFYIQIYQVCISIKCKSFVNLVPIFGIEMKGDPCCDLSIAFFGYIGLFIF